MKSYFLACVFLCVSATAALCADWNYTNEVFGTLGWTRVSGERESARDGPLYGGGIALHPFSRFEFQVDGFVMKASKGQSSGLRAETTDTVVSGSVNYYPWSTSAARMYLTFGGGALHQDRTISVKLIDPFLGDTITIRLSQVETRSVFNAGVGVKVAIASRVHITPEFRYFVSVPAGFHILKVSSCVGYAW